MPEAKQDQTDVVAANAKLTGELATAQAALATATSQISALTKERDDAQASVTTLTASVGAKDVEIAALKKERDDAKAESAKLAGEKATVEATVAATVVKLGISATDNKDEKTTAKKLTATEQVLAAKGVKSLAELEAKRIADQNK